MKFNIAWLREWIDLKMDDQALIDRLNMSGFEVESVTPMNGDIVLEISVTPNRGDCLSIQGLAREIASLTGASFHPPEKIPRNDQSFKGRFQNDCGPFHSEACRGEEYVPLKLRVSASEACPRYLGRYIRGVDPKRESPAWLVARLTCAGFKTISPMVDITNYVMLELGQPLHAFDARCLSSEKPVIGVRFAKEKERITLLDGQMVQLNSSTLVITDGKKPIAIAGVMGGFDSAVKEDTTDIWLEVASFNARFIANQARRYGVHSDSAFRFERGVDPALATQAMEYATQLLLEIVGGQAESVQTYVNKKYFPKVHKITLPVSSIEKVLGITLPMETVTDLLCRLHAEVKATKKQWYVTPPHYRFDLRLPEDLIEEIARLYGYESIEPQPLMRVPSTPDPLHQPLRRLRRLLVDRGYREVITYSFSRAAWPEHMELGESKLSLMNPLSPDWAVMRTSLLPSLLSTLEYNMCRQQDRVRFFEIGTRFVKEGDTLRQEAVLSGLISATALPEQWAEKTRPIDFFDVKADVEALCDSLHEVVFERCVDPSWKLKMLHPGQSAQIKQGEQVIGVLGRLHPETARAWNNLSIPVYFFEILLSPLLATKKIQWHSLSKFPRIRRDLAFWVSKEVTAAAICKSVEQHAGDNLKEVRIFDVYQKMGDAAEKSIALALWFERADRTWKEEDIQTMMDNMIQGLMKDCHIRLRT